MPYIDQPSVEAVGKRDVSCSSGKQVTFLDGRFDMASSNLCIEML